MEEEQNKAADKTEDKAEEKEQVKPPRPPVETQAKGNKSGKGKKFLQMFIVAIIIAAIAGGGVWYYMNNKNKTAKTANDKAISTLNANIADLNKQLAAAKTSKSTTTTTTTTSTNDFATLNTFCLNADPNNEVGTIQLVENTNGKYGNCVVSQKGEPSGGMLISTYLNGKWTKIWEGNGVMEASNCTQYKIPKSIYEDCAGYYQ